MKIKKHDIILMNTGYIREVEVLQVANGFYKIGTEWYSEETMQNNVKVKLGEAIYRPGLCGIKRTVKYIGE